MKKYSGIDYLVYESPARVENWFQLVIFGVIAVTLIPAIILVQIELIGAWVMFGVTVFDAALFYFIVPRSYQIYTNKVVIVLGKPFRINLPLSSIKSVGHASDSSAFVFFGMQFATSHRDLVKLERRFGTSVLISPSNPNMFIEQLEEVLDQ